MKTWGKSGIYKFSFKNGKFYIGSAKNLSARRSSHLSQMRKANHGNRHIQNCFNKHGEPNFETLLICDQEDLIFFEQRAIDTLEPHLNICKKAGNTLGRKHTPESLKKTTEANRRNSKKESWRKGVSKGWFKKGEKRPLTEAQKEKFGKAWIGRKHKNESKLKMSESAKKRPIDSFNIEGLKIGRIVTMKKVRIRKQGDYTWLEFKSIKEAAKYVGAGSMSKISMALRGKNGGQGNCYKKWEWEYAV